MIGVLSGKGGVGKSFVALNLALVLAKNAMKIGIFDADICCPHIFSLLGIKNKLSFTNDGKIVPGEKYGLKAVSMAGMCDSPDEPMAWRGPIITKIMQKLLRESIWGELDSLIIDFPSGTGDIPLTLLQQFAISGLIFVTTPQEASLTQVRRAINMALMLKVPLLGIVENMRGETFGEGGGNKLSAMTGLPLLGSIPMRKNIVTNGDTGIPALAQSEELEMIFSKIARSASEKLMVE